ncbi:MAG: aspartate--tRNA(Asn) ligase [Patescibacteria group bacterium]|nr:aspartate--tRNA(Asn) ligase [Patescibacteria group bacterium]
MSEEKLERTLSSETVNKVGQKVLVKGWVKTRRDHGKLIFLDLRDRSSLIQIVINPHVSEEVYKVAVDIKPEFVVEITGEVKQRPEKLINKNLLTGTVEIEAHKVKIISKAETLPFDMGQETLNLELPTLLDHRSLTLRHPKIQAIFKIQQTIVSSFRDVLKEEDFTEIFVPTLVPIATEGGAEVFPVNYYGHKAYLAQSPQLYKQIMVSIFERVFTVAHAYRAEPSVTTRHLSEYVSMDAEFGFISSWTDLMDMAEKVIISIIKKVSQENKEELNLLGVVLPEITKPIPRLKLKEAQKILFEKTGIDHRSDPDLDPSDEKEICRWAEEQTGAPFVFVTHYPTKKRPFYTMPDRQDPEYTLSFDLLGINEEWVTGGQRINDYDMLLDHIKKWGNSPQNFEIYLQAFRYGMPPEGGFAIGLERITKDILGIANIREASLFPRDMERVDERLSVIDKEEAKAKQ